MSLMTSIWVGEETETSLWIKYKNINKSFNGARKGYSWTMEEWAKLQALYREGKDLNQICYEMERPAGGVLPKLINLGLVKQEAETGDIYRVQQPNNQEVKHETQPEQETQMSNTKVIEVKAVTTIYGVDASTKSDDEIFSLISKLEKEVETLAQIKNKPKKLDKKIEDINEDIKKLVDYVDSRG